MVSLVFAAMFLAPRQSGIDALASREEDIRAFLHDTLVNHGREDQVMWFHCQVPSLWLIGYAARSCMHSAAAVAATGHKFSIPSV